MNFRKAIIDLFLIVILITCIGYGTKYKNNNEEGKSLAEFNIEDRKMQAKSIEEIISSKKDDTYIFTALKEEKNTVTNKGLNKEAETTIMKITGNSSILFNSTILFMEDKNGCLIDKDLAYKLFGSYDVKGLKIEIEDKNYIIRDVLENKEGLAVIQSGPEEEMELLALDITNKDEGYIENFLTKYGFEDNYTTNKIYEEISNLMRLILPLIIMFLIIINMLKLIKGDKNKPIKKTILISFFFLLIYIFYLIIDVKLKINYNLIPNEWSDFDYWRELIIDYHEKNRELLFSKKYAMDISLINNMIRSVLCSIISIIVFFILKSRIKITNRKELIKLLIVIAFIETFMVCKVSEHNHIVIYLLPYYYMSLYIIRFVNEKRM